MSATTSPRYVWPSSALSLEDMALLHAVRESSLPRVPINRLIAHAVRSQYAAVRDSGHRSSPSTVAPQR